jgi:hypothetical protein
MLTMIDNEKTDEQADPGLWAPFVLEYPENRGKDQGQHIVGSVRRYERRKGSPAGSARNVAE